MERVIHEPARYIPVLTECDVLVVGGGPAGISAVIGAARLGKKAVVVERYGCLGGILTTNNMETPAWWRDEGATMPGGIFEELESRLIAADLAQPSFFRPAASLAFDTEALKIVADDMVSENGAVSILHCIGVTPLMEGNVIKGVVTESKSGRRVILAKRVVDCTGDGDIAARAGASYLMAEEPTGRLPAGELIGGTVVYGLSDVDTERFIEDVDADPTSRHPILHKLVYRGNQRARADGVKIPYGLREGGYVYNRVEKNAIPALNHAWIRVDGTDVRSLTEAEITSRKAIVEGLAIHRKYTPGMENAKLRHFSMGIGIRETRRIVGDYMLSLNDVFAEGRCEDSVGVYPFCSDGPEGTIPASTPRYFQVPFRITVPTGVENLLVAGRCVSANRRCYGVSRMVNFAMLTGQAAGVACAVSAAGETNVREVSVADVQRELTRQGVRVS